MYVRAQCGECADSFGGGVIFGCQREAAIVVFHAGRGGRDYFCTDCYMLRQRGLQRRLADAWDAKIMNGYRNGKNYGDELLEVPPPKPTDPPHQHAHYAERKKLAEEQALLFRGHL